MKEEVMKLFKNVHIILMLFFLFLSPTSINAAAVPLSTSNRWIVDSSGNRVKLACVSWPSHLLPVVTEGLNKRPLDDISKIIKSMGFNCVRFTWPLYLVTNGMYVNVTMRESLAKLGLKMAIEGVRYYNPTLLDQPLLQVFKEVVHNMDKNGIMIILDNHITTPGWCCSTNDGNGFFGDKYFDPSEWITGLTQMAQMFNSVQNVVGMSLRNEPRGPNQNIKDWWYWYMQLAAEAVHKANRNQNIKGWYRYMQLAAEAVHKANPNLLIIVSGLNFDTDLSFLSSKDFSISFTSKLVFELHWYAFTDGAVWDTNANDACGSVTNRVKTNAGFLLDKGPPLFLSEWGVDQRGKNLRDDKFLGCLLGWAAETDVDWSLWALQGSYYLRDGVLDMEEFYGALNLHWDRVRSPAFLQRISALQSPFQGPGLNAETYTIIFHPSTGYCVAHSPLRIGWCKDAKPWIYTADKTIQVYGTDLYLKAQGLGKSVTLTQKSDNDQSFVWDLISNSKMHVSTKYGNGLCLDVDQDNNSIVSNECKCLSQVKDCDPEYQWFKMVSSSRPL